MERDLGTYGGFGLKGRYIGAMKGKEGYLYRAEATADEGPPFTLRVVLFESVRDAHKIARERVREVMEACVRWKLKELIDAEDLHPGKKASYQIPRQIARNAAEGRLL